MRPLPLIATLVLFTLPASAAQAEALYRVDFDATWSSTTHPGAYPGGAHFSPLIGGTHSNAVSFWAPGGTATAGIESMAETGATGSLTSEVQAAISAGTAGEVIAGNGASSPGSASTTFLVTDEHPLASVVTMIAPSPDWFLGVHDLELFDGADFVDELSVELFAYDAGTDSGPSFNSGNQNTNPAQPIAMITGGPFFGTTALGTFTFTRIASTQVYGCSASPDSLAVAGQPLLGETVDFVADAPASGLGSSAAFLFVSLTAPAGPCGISLPGLGELLVPTIDALVSGPTWSGSPVSIPVVIPAAPVLVDASVYVQGALYDGTTPSLTRAAELTIGS